MTESAAEKPLNGSADSKKGPKKPKAPPSHNYSPHLNPVHVGTVPSLLSRRLRPSLTLSSSEARNQRRELEGRPTSVPLDVSGFKHLLMLVLVTGNVKMMWSDWGQFGFKNTLKHFGLGFDDIKMALIVFGTNLFYMPIALGIEKAASSVSRRCGHHSSFDMIHYFLCSLCLVVGSVLTWRLVDHPLMATACESNTIVTFLKLMSFVHTNAELRRAATLKTELPEFYLTGPQYPTNLTLQNMVHFWLAPTLVYQPVYPQRQEIRWTRVLSLMGEILTGIVLIWVLIMQMALPVLEHLVNNKHSLRTSAEDYLSLATLNITIWVIGFIVLFQSTLNLSAEVTRFADRRFYGDWWNAGSVGTFWRDWNLPVSNYFRRHLYTPLRLKGWSQMLASNAVFLVSALLHELLFGVATHNFNGVAFTSMMLQPILVLLTAPLEKMRGKGTTIGNCVFWLSILFGQPTAIVIYYLEWVERNPSSKGSGLWFQFGS